MRRKPKSAEVRARFFTARASGATLRQAAAAGVFRTARHYWLAQSGGGRPGAATIAGRKGSDLASFGSPLTLTAIAAELGRSVSTSPGDGF